MNNITVESIGIWDGTNYIQIISILVTRNEEMKVRVKGNRLVIKDTEAGYYRCITIGDKVEIPKYDKSSSSSSELVESN